MAHDKSNGSEGAWRCCPHDNWRTGAYPRPQETAEIIACDEEAPDSVCLRQMFARNKTINARRDGRCEYFLISCKAFAADRKVSKAS